MINRNAPTQIVWKNLGAYPGESRYRSIVFRNGRNLVFFGGSNETYNYNGLSYDGKLPVEPNREMLVYNMVTGQWKLKQLNRAQRLMDLRNAPQLNDYVYMAGGMTAHQKVSNRLVILDLKDFQK